jgi:leucyl-tRNA synthetase
VLYDLGYVSTREPFKKLVNQGMILGEDGQKMSKSRGNVINPDVIIEEFGADTLRMYEMFMGPLEQVKPWNTQSVGGVYKFLGRCWNLIIGQDGELHGRINSDDCTAKDPLPVERALHRTIKKVGEDLEQLKFHTAIAALMTFVNEAQSEKELPVRAARQFVLLLAPFAPHLGEELWQKLGAEETLAYHPWPEFDPDLAKQDLVTIAIQVKGKLRDTIDVEPGIEDDALITSVLALPKIKAQIEGKDLIRKIVVPNKLVNLVVK